MSEKVTYSEGALVTYEGEPRYRINKALAVGRHGVVHAGVSIARPIEQVAIKIIKPYVLDPFKEVGFARHFDHENIMPVTAADYMDVHSQDRGVQEHPVIISPLAIATLEVINKEEDMPQELILEMLRQIAIGIDAIHEENILHRDLKPENIFADFDHNDDGQMRIGDFSCAMYGRHEQLKTIEGTAAYIAPEAFIGRLSPSADFYSFAVIAYESLSRGKMPFDVTYAEGEDELTYFDKWSDFHDEPDREVLPFAQKDPIFDLFYSVLAPCLSVNSADRPKKAIDLYHQLEHAYVLGAATIEAS